MARLDGKVAFVTGAASGIGAATALRFAQEGARVFGFDLKEAFDKIDKIVEQGRGLIQNVAKYKFAGVR